MTAKDKNPTEKKTYFVEPMSDREWQRHVLRMARRNGWEGVIPVRLGTPGAKSTFHEAEAFLLKKGILRES